MEKLLQWSGENESRSVMVSGEEGRWGREINPGGRGFAEVEFRWLFIKGEKCIMASPHSIGPKVVTHQCGRLE